MKIEPDLRRRLLLAFPATRLGSLAMALYMEALEAWPGTFVASPTALGRLFGVLPGSVRAALTQLERHEILYWNGDGWVPELNGAWSPAFAEAQTDCASTAPSVSKAQTDCASENVEAQTDCASETVRPRESANGLRFRNGSGAKAQTDCASETPSHMEAPARIKFREYGDGNEIPIPQSPPHKAPRPAAGPRDLPVDPGSGLAMVEGADGTLTPVGELPDPKGSPEYARLVARAEELFPTLDMAYHLDGHRRSYPLAWIERALEDKAANSPRYRPKTFHSILNLLRSWSQAEPPGPPAIAAPGPADPAPAAGRRGYGAPAKSQAEIDAEADRIIAEREAVFAEREREAAAAAPPPVAPPAGSLVAKLAASLKAPKD